MAALLHIQSELTGGYHFKECLLSTEIEGIKRTYFPYEVFFNAVFYSPLCI